MNLLPGHTNNPLKNDLVGKINGNPYAVDYFRQPMNADPMIKQYNKGVDTFHVDEFNDHSWIANGYDDTIPYILRTLYKRSSIHNSAVGVKANLIAGSGYEFTPLESYLKRNEEGFFERVELSLGDTEKEALVKEAELAAANIILERYRRDCAMQLSLYGGYFSLRTYMLDLKANGFLRRVMTEDYSRCRLGSKRQFINNEFISSAAYVSDDWRYAAPYKVVQYEEYIKANRKINDYRIGILRADDGQVKERGQTGVFYKHVGRVTPYRDFYCTPDYETQDAMAMIAIDYMLSQYDFKALSDGFSLDCIIVRYRSKMATEAEEKTQKKKDKDFIQKNYKGFTGERSLLVWADPKTDNEGQPVYPKQFEVIQIPKDGSPERLNILREERTMKILNAHNIVAPETIGMPQIGKGSGLSSQAEYLVQSLETLYWGSIRPLQELHIEDVNELFLSMGIPVQVKIKDSRVNYRVATEKMLQFMLGIDESRGVFGFDAMTEEVAEEVHARIMKGKAQIEEDEKNNPKTKEE